MKQKIAFYLKDLFPRVHGFNFQEVEKLGSENIRMLIAELRDSLSYFSKEMEKTEEKINSLGKKQPLNEMEVTELGTKLSFQRIRFGHRKLVISNLKTLLPKAVIKPVLPSLRNSKHFIAGDDVMVFIGKNSIVNNETRITSPYNWVCGKALLCTDHPDEQPIYICMNNRFNMNGSMKGHFWQTLTTSPFVFKRKEFYQMREMLRSNQDPEFIKIFFACCEVSPERYSIMRIHNPQFLETLILDDKVEEITDKQLKENTARLIMDAIILAKHDRMMVNEAIEMAKLKKIKLPKELESLF